MPSPVRIGRSSSQRRRVSAIRDADRIIGLLEASGFERIDLVINRMRYEMVRRGDMMSVDDVVDILSIPAHRRRARR